MTDLRCRVCGGRLSVTHLDGEYAVDNGHGRAMWRSCKPASNAEKKELIRRDKEMGEFYD